MAEELPQISIGEFETVSQLVSSSDSLQMALLALGIGIIIIVLTYRKFSSWIGKQKFSYTNPHGARFAAKAILPFLAIALISSTNVYIQAFELFDPNAIAVVGSEFTPEEVFAKMLNTLNILVIGYTISQLVPIALAKRDLSVTEHEDYEIWKDMHGFPDDEDDLFHKLFSWVPPKQIPEDLTQEEFQKYLETMEGIRFLEQFRTSKGSPIGSYEKNVTNPFEEWKKSERKKYEKYFTACVTGNNESGRKLFPGVVPEEIYPFDTWKEMKRSGSFDPIIPGGRSVGYARKKKQGVPKSVKQIIPIILFVAVIIGVVSWWGVAVSYTHLRAHET